VNVHIVGGSGFVGRRLVRRLVGEGHHVSGLVRSDEAARRLSEAGGTPIDGNLMDAPSVDAALAASGAQALITSVSLALGFGPDIVASAERHGVARGVFVSTTSVHTALDAVTKPIRIAAEDHIRSSTLAWTIIRPTMIYGAGDDRNMSRLLALLRRTPVLPLPGGGRGLIQPVHVDDVVGAIVAALRPQAAGRIYEVAGPDAMTLRDLVHEASAALGRNVRTFAVPFRPVIVAARIAERLGIGPVRSEQVERLAEDKAFDIGAARRELGFAPRTFREGITAEARALSES
jgi:uncharacterized protein YbjT (DUF2867 family)